MAPSSVLISSSGMTFAATAADKSDIFLALAQVVIGVEDDLLSAGNSTGNAADTLAVVNNSTVINNRNSALGAGLDTILTAYTAPGADGISLMSSCPAETLRAASQERKALFTSI